MKKYKLLAILLIFALMFSLVSCKNEDSHDNHDSLNDQHEDTEQQGGEGYVTFYYSVTSDSYHVEGCYHIYPIKEKFLKTSTDAAALAADGYSPCRDCIAVKENVDTEDDNKISKDEATYVIGTTTGKLHELDCHNVDSIQEKNKEYTNLTIDELMELDKYAPCKDCLPNEAKIYYEKHPEKDPSNKK